jgi:hemoglobin-like flavoprotein
MTADQVRLVRSSFERLDSKPEEFALAFYARLFAIDPSLRPLFGPDLRDQARKLASMLALAVRVLDDPDTLAPVVQQLGRRHTGYGVAAGHYHTVGAALIWTLQQQLGTGFTSDVRDAWLAAFGALAGMMQTAAAA